MTAKYTSKPWRFVDRRPISGNWAMRIPFAIEWAPPGCSAVVPIADVCDQPNAEDNARLIAASPELLEALERLANPTPGTKKLPPWAYGIIMPALAKARGETR